MRHLGERKSQKQSNQRLGGTQYSIALTSSGFCNSDREDRNPNRDATYGGGGGLDILLLLSLLINFGSPWGNSVFVGARNCIDGRRTSSFKSLGTFDNELRFCSTTEAVTFFAVGLNVGEALM